jgi:hypothetical protein
MLNMRVEAVIRVIRNLLMPQNSANEFRVENLGTERHMRGIVFGFDITLYDNTDRPEGSARKESRRGIQVLVAGHSSVFTSTSKTHDDRDDTWTNLSNHDSCWHSSMASELTQIYFEMCEEVDANQRPSDIVSYNTFDVFRPLRFVDVVWEPTEDRTLSGYRKVLSVINVPREKFETLGRRG